MTGRSEPAGDPLAPEILLHNVTETVQRIHEARDLTAAALVLAESAARNLGADFAGVSLHTGREVPQRLAATNDALLGLDEREQALPSSPRRVPLAQGITVLVDDVAVDRRWPEWAALAGQLGVRSVLIAGIPEIRRHAVTLELYSRGGDGFVHIDAGVAMRMATLVGLALQYADRSTNLEEALLTRGLVGQAQGIVMERFGLDGGQAMAYLRRRSQQSQQPVRQLAAEIVAGRDGRSTVLPLDDERFRSESAD